MFVMLPCGGVGVSIAHIHTHTLISASFKHTAHLYVTFPISLIAFPHSKHDAVGREDKVEKCNSVPLQEGKM